MDKLYIDKERVVLSLMKHGIYIDDSNFTVDEESSRIVTYYNNKRIYVSFGNHKKSTIEPIKAFYNILEYRILRELNNE